MPVETVPRVRRAQPLGGRERRIEANGSLLVEVEDRPDGRAHGEEPVRVRLEDEVPADQPHQADATREVAVDAEREADAAVQLVSADDAVEIDAEPDVGRRRQRVVVRVEPALPVVHATLEETEPTPDLEDLLLVVDRHGVDRLVLQEELVHRPGVGRDGGVEPGFGLVEQRPVVDLRDAGDRLLRRLDEVERNVEVRVSRVAVAAMAELGLHLDRHRSADEPVGLGRLGHLLGVLAALAAALLGRDDLPAHGRDGVRCLLELVLAGPLHPRGRSRLADRLLRGTGVVRERDVRRVRDAQPLPEGEGADEREKRGHEGREHSSMFHRCLLTARWAATTYKVATPYKGGSWGARQAECPSCVYYPQIGMYVVTQAIFHHRWPDPLRNWSRPEAPFGKGGISPNRLRNGFNAPSEPVFLENE